MARSCLLKSSEDVTESTECAVCGHGNICMVMSFLCTGDVLDGSGQRALHPASVWAWDTCPFL